MQCIYCSRVCRLLVPRDGEGDDGVAPPGPGSLIMAPLMAVLYRRKRGCGCGCSAKPSGGCAEGVGSGQRRGRGRPEVK